MRDPALGVLAAIFLLAGSVPAAQESPSRPSSILAVVGGTLIDGTGADPIPDSAVIIENDRIVAAGPRRQTRIPPGAVAVDATDLTVLPGLIDMHVHLLDGVDVRRFVEFGVTSVRHLGDTSIEWITSLKKRVDSGEMVGPRIFHCGAFVVSEPPLKESDYSADELNRFMIMKSPADAPEVVRRLAEAGADVVKVKTEMTPENLRALVAAAAEAHLPVTFDNGGESGHYDALDAFEAGVSGVEHLSGILFDDPAATEAAYQKILAAHACADPTFVVLDLTYSARRVAMREAFIRRFAAAGGCVLAGTDVPTRALIPGQSLHKEIARLVSAGLTNMQAILAATGTAGRALGYQGTVGTIEAGAYADVVIVAGDPLKEIQATGKIVRVIKGGKEVFPFSDDQNGLPHQNPP